MKKGIFTQGIAILLEKAVTLDDLERVLSGYKVSARNRDYDPEGWQMFGPELGIRYRSEVNGYIGVDIVTRPWPDSMGESDPDRGVIQAHEMGFFGPFTFPRSLERAMEYNDWWPDASEVISGHRAFLRVRSTYTRGPDPAAPVRPPDYDPLAELLFVSEIAVALLGLPEALAYFNPNGEALHTPEQVRSFLNGYRKGGPLPFPLWANVRTFLDDEKAHFFSPKRRVIVVDTVGLPQLDVPDQLARCYADRYTAADATHFLYNAAVYLMEHGTVFQVGETLTLIEEEHQQSKVWTLEAIKPADVGPPRTVYHWRAP